MKSIQRSILEAVPEMHSRSTCSVLKSEATFLNPSRFAISVRPHSCESPSTKRTLHYDLRNTIPSAVESAGFTLPKFPYFKACRRFHQTLECAIGPRKALFFGVEAGTVLMYCASYSLKSSWIARCLVCSLSAGATPKPCQLPRMSFWAKGSKFSSRIW